MQEHTHICTQSQFPTNIIISCLFHLTLTHVHTYKSPTTPFTTYPPPPPNLLTVLLGIQKFTLILQNLIKTSTDQATVGGVTLYYTPVPWWGVDGGMYLFYLFSPNFLSQNNSFFLIYSIILHCIFLIVWMQGLKHILWLLLRTFYATFILVRTLCLPLSWQQTN